MKIKFECIDDVCTTPCPHNFKLGDSVINVASAACKRCRYFSIELDSKHIECIKEIK